MMLRITVCVLLFALLSCGEKPEEKQNPINNEEEIIEKYLKNGAWNYNFLTKESDEWINKGLIADSTVAYLWQQKANPYWKRKKYSLAVSFYDRAVELDREKWLSRLGFMKCIFVKDYKGALLDLAAYKNEFGSNYEQDHSLEFYMGLCYLQLDQYENALVVLEEMIKQEGPNWLNYLDRYYLAIAYYELGEYDKAITEFEKVLIEYPRFSDAQYYKSICLNYIGKKEEAKSLMEEGRLNFTSGHSFNEDSSKYEVYPYQITWQWDSADSMLNK